MEPALQHLLDKTEAALQIEERRIADGIDEARRGGIAVHENHWEHVHKLRLRRRMILQILDALTVLAASPP